MNSVHESHEDPRPSPPRSETTTTGAVLAPNEEERNAVTPSPASKAALKRDTPSLPSSDLESLRKLLAPLSEAETDSLSSFLASFDASTLDDLAFIREDYFKHSSLTYKIQSKLLYVAEFLKRGGSLEDVGSMKDLVKAVQTSSVEASTARSLSLPSDRPPRAADDSNEIIRLDVGGHKFSTSRKTLCRVPNSVLGVMFSGRHEHPALRNTDGSYFIDRDGTYFPYVLTYLRVGAIVSLPKDSAAKEALAIEADFYGLDDLGRAIRMPQVDVSECLPEEVLAIRHAEDELRTAFVATHGATGLDSHLVSLFEEEEGVTPPVTFQPNEAFVESTYVCMDFRDKAPPGTPVTVTTLEQFQTNFNREHPNILHRLTDVLLEEPVIVAGGAVLQSLTSSDGIRTASWWGEKSDIDLFLHCQDPAEANRIAQRVFYSLAVDDEKWVVMRSRGVITMHSFGPETNAVDEKVQIVLRLYESPTEVLIGFDCDCCCCAYDGRSVWVTPRCLYALRTGLNILNPLHAWPNKASYELRLAKYASRGFPVAVPGIDKKRVDADRILGTTLSKLKGMARLLKVSFVMETEKGERAHTRPPEDIRPLRPELETCFDDAEVLMKGGMQSLGGYDDSPENLIVPSVYAENGRADGRAEVWQWWYGEFFHASETRDGAWAEIVSTEEAPDCVPARLVDAWDRKKRSREYLNGATMDKFDLDTIYYSEAYERDA